MANFYKNREKNTSNEEQDALNGHSKKEMQTNKMAQICSVNQEKFSLRNANG